MMYLLIMYYLQKIKSFKDDKWILFLIIGTLKIITHLQCRTQVDVFAKQDNMK